MEGLLCRAVPANTSLHRALRAVIDPGLDVGLESVWGESLIASFRATRMLFEEERAPPTARFEQQQSTS